MTLILSSGAVHDLDTAPAMPPAIRLIFQIPIFISFSVKSSGTMIFSPTSIIYRNAKENNSINYYDEIIMTTNYDSLQQSITSH